MKETLHCSNGQDETRLKRAFGWIITFRDFPTGSWQSVDGDSMMTEALTLFTKGRAEFFLDGVTRGDRVPGILSSEHEVVGQGGEFTIRYVEPTTRLCIPKKANKHKDCLPTVVKHELKMGEQFLADGKYLVCLGSVSANKKLIAEECTFQTAEECICMALELTILLQFLN